VQRYDPTYQATKLHFEDLAKRYGNPIIVLNLIKVITQIKIASAKNVNKYQYYMLFDSLFSLVGTSLLSPSQFLQRKLISIHVPIPTSE